MQDISPQVWVSIVFQLVTVAAMAGALFAKMASIQKTLDHLERDVRSDFKQHVNLDKRVTAIEARLKFRSRSTDTDTEEEN